MRTRWASQQQTTQVQVTQSPTYQFVQAQRLAGVPREIIIERLLQKGVPFKDVKAAFQKAQTVSMKGKLDWRSPTAINETARMIRRDIRRRKISYSLGMQVLIRARNMLKTMIRNPQSDRRVSQLNQEIWTTKRLLMNQFADPVMRKQYHIY